MKSVIMIKKIKKYEKYEISLDNGLKNVLLICKNQKTDEKDVEINPHYLVKATQKLGKNLCNIITEELKKRTPEPDRAFKLRKPLEKEIVKKYILEYIDAFNNNKNKNYSHYRFAFDFYTEAFKLLKKQNEKEVSDEYHPKLINIQIKETERNNFWGIMFTESIPGRDVEKAYNEVFGKIKDKIDIIDCASLLDTIDYMPYDIRYLFTEIFVISENSDNTKSKEIGKYITEWCEQFGMPFWTDRNINERAAKNSKKITYTGETIDEFSLKEQPVKPILSEYELAKNSVPIINLISISLSIYLFSVLWKKYIKKEIITKEEKKKLEYIMAIIVFDKINNSDIIELISKADEHHNYIMENFNCIYETKLNIYEKKIPYKNGNKILFYNVKEYESVAIAAWDVFYHDYLGNSEITKPLPFCNKCHKQVPKGQSHSIENKEILCDECYAIRKKEKTNARVRKHRALKNNNNQELN